MSIADKNGKKNGTVSFTKHVTAGIMGDFRGRVSDFNQNQIIGVIAILSLVIICFFNLKLYPNFAMPILVTSIIIFFLLLIGSFIRHCCYKPGEDLAPSTRIWGINKAMIEIKDMPTSYLTKEFFQALCSLTFFQNEPPVGLIKGDPADKKSIVMLSEEARGKLQKQEEAAILEHQNKIRREIKNLPQPTTNTSQN